jgi:hypothetical protein
LGRLDPPSFRIAVWYGTSEHRRCFSFTVPECAVRRSDGYGQRAPEVVLFDEAESGFVLWKRLVRALLQDFPEFP